MRHEKQKKLFSLCLLLSVHWEADFDNFWQQRTFTFVGNLSLYSWVWFTSIEAQNKSVDTSFWTWFSCWNSLNSHCPLEVEGLLEEGRLRLMSWTTVFFQLCGCSLERLFLLSTWVSSSVEKLDWPAPSSDPNPAPLGWAGTSQTWSANVSLRPQWRSYGWMYANPCSRFSLWCNGQVSTYILPSGVWTYIPPTGHYNLAQEKYFHLVPVLGQLFEFHSESDLISHLIKGILKSKCHMDPSSELESRAAVFMLSRSWSIKTPLESLSDYKLWHDFEHLCCSSSRKTGWHSAAASRSN